MIYELNALRKHSKRIATGYTINLTPTEAKRIVEAFDELLHFCRIMAGSKPQELYSKYGPVGGKDEPR